jgi:hypothetical protein
MDVKGSMALGQARLSLDGVVKPHANIPSEVDLDLKMTITNLTAQIAKVSEEIKKDPTAETTRPLRDFVTFATVIDMVGKPQGLEPDSPKLYHFETSDTGQLLLNGVDLSQIMPAKQP